MSEEKTVSLVQLQEAWQNQPEITINFGGDPQSTKAMIQSLLEQNRRRQKWTNEFGVLLQRLITELPQQAKTFEEVFIEDYLSPNRTTEKKWLALEVIKGKTQERKK